MAKDQQPKRYRVSNQTLVYPFIVVTMEPIAPIIVPEQAPDLGLIVIPAPQEAPRE